MQKHYILTLDPTAKYEWDRCTLRDPMTAARPDLAQLVRDAVGEASGNYLVAIKLEVEVLEQTAVVAEEGPVTRRGEAREVRVASSVELPTSNPATEPPTLPAERPIAVRFRNGETPKRSGEPSRPVEAPNSPPNHHLAAV